jgi:hypothetical protein
MSVTGTGMPANTTISAIISQDGLTLSKAATFTSNSTLTFPGAAYQSVAGANIVFPAPGTRDISVQTYPGGIQPNNNLFIGQSLEGDVTEYTIDNNGGTDNTWIKERWEGAAPRVWLHGVLGAGSSRNKFEDGVELFTVQFIDDIYTASTEVKGPDYDFNATSAVNGNNIWMNTSSNTSPVMTTVPTAFSPLSSTNAAKNWTFQLSAARTLAKAPTDVYGRIFFNHLLGYFCMADGTVDLTQGDGPCMGATPTSWYINTGNLTFYNSAWNGPHPVLGAYHIWMDTNSPPHLRYKSSAPSSDTDGALINNDMNTQYYYNGIQQASSTIQAGTGMLSNGTLTIHLTRIMHEIEDARDQFCFKHVI